MNWERQTTIRNQELPWQKIEQLLLITCDSLCLNDVGESIT